MKIHTFKTHYLAWILFLLFRQTIITITDDTDRSSMTIITAMIIVK